MQSRRKGGRTGRVIMQACVHAGLEAREPGDRDVRDREFPVFSLFGSDIFGRIPGFTGLFAGFPIRPPPFTEIYRHVRVHCTPWLRHWKNRYDQDLA